ncbi:Yip1 family protein [Methanolacinia petrolearia]|uniref:Yip1 family protein n=1 Tax=Methanolacinia petrolearia TaxID=54120 RepID=UPI003BAA075B
MISVKEILITPGHFFEKKCREKASLKVPVLIVLITAVISGISAYIVSGKTFEAMGSGLEGYAFIASLFGFAVAFIGMFISWAIRALAFLVMIYILKGTATFKQLAEVAGYGFIPQIFGGIITTAIMMTSIQNLVIPATSNMQEIEVAMKAFTTSAPMMAASFVSIIFTIWSANIWLFGIKESSGLEFKKAAICVGVPLVIFIILSLSSFVM